MYKYAHFKYKNFETDYKHSSEITPASFFIFFLQLKPNEIRVFIRNQILKYFVFH